MIAKYLIQGRYVIVSLLGSLFALLTWKIMQMELRYAAAVTGALALLSCSMIMVYSISDFLIYTLVFNIPFAEFSKWILLQEVVVPAKGVSIGLFELLIIIAYFYWFARVFIARTEPLPEFYRIDVLIILLLLFQSFSLIAARDKMLAMLDIVYNIKYALIYFFLSRKLERRHLKWLVVIFIFAICLESSFALYERATGNVGIGQSKGNKAAEEYGTQYQVPGIENEIRAMGTTNDSHTLGLYFSMLLPIPIVLAAMKYLKASRKVLLSAIVLLGIGGLVLTFSRSGWLAFAISSAFALWVIMFRWKQGRAVIFILGIVLLANLFYPKAYEYIYTRLVEAPSGIMEVRMEMNKTALLLWKDNFFFGYGAGNYVTALSDPNVTVYGRDDLPVHNAFLWAASETGIFGAAAFFGILAAAMWRCYRQLKCGDLMIRGLGLALLTAFFSYLLDGITDPMYRFPVPYALLWTFIAMSVSFERIVKEEGLAGAPSDALVKS